MIVPATWGVSSTPPERIEGAGQEHRGIPRAERCAYRASLSAAFRLSDTGERQGAVILGWRSKERTRQPSIDLPATGLVGNE